MKNSRVFILPGRQREVVFVSSTRFPPTKGRPDRKSEAKDWFCGQGVNAAKGPYHLANVACIPAAWFAGRVWLLGQAEG